MIYSKNDKYLFAKKINKSDIINDSTTGGTTKVLSAEQGKVHNQHLTQLDQQFTGLDQQADQVIIELGYIYDHAASLNLYNKANALTGKIISNDIDGGLTDDATVAFSGLVEVESGKSYLIVQPLEAVGAIFAFDDTVTAPLYTAGGICAETAAGTQYGTWTYDETKFTREEYVTEEGYYATKVTIIDENIKNISWLMPLSASWTYSTDEFTLITDAIQVVEGIEEKPYQAYGESYTIKNSSLPSISSMLGYDETCKDIIVVKEDEYTSVRVKWTDELDFYTLWKYPSTLYNKGLALEGMYTTPKSTPHNIITGTSWKDSSDDIAPLSLNGSYVGGNCGFLKVDSITAAAHGKAIADIGSLWAINATNYILMDVVDEDTLLMLGDFTTVQLVPVSPLAEATGTLTHVSGATNTADIVYTAKTLTQILPNTNKKSFTLLLDGIEVNDNGVYRANKVDLIEKYTITDIPSIQAFLKAAVGGTTKPNLEDDSIAGWIEVTNIFTHGRNGSVTVKTAYNYLKETTIGFYTVVQSESIGTKAYVPNVGTVGELDLSTVVTQGAASLDFAAATWLDAEKPPYRYHQFNNDLSKGIALGYNQSFGVAKPAIRKLDTDAGEFAYPDYIMYPKAKFNSSAAVGDYQETIAFRVPLRVIDTDATCLYWYWVGEDIYLAFDYHKNIDKVIELPSYMVGKKIESLDVHLNTTIQSEFVSSTGIKVKITNNYGYAVLRLYD